MKKYRCFYLSIVFIILIGLAIGCAADNQDNRDESTHILPTGGTLLYEDDFSSPDSGWSVDNTEEIDRHYQNGEYYIDLKKANWMYWIWNKKIDVFEDFMINIDARLTSEPYSNYYGLIFRHQDDNNFYRFLVRGDGYYLIGTRTNGALTQLQGWTETPFIKEGKEENHLTVVCKGSQITLFINEQYLTTINDSTFSSGHVGLIVGSPQSNSVYSVFDNIQVYSIR